MVLVRTRLKMLYTTSLYKTFPSAILSPPQRAVLSAPCRSAVLVFEVV